MIRLWLWPVVVALLSLLGLIAGLVSEGLGDGLSWAELGRAGRAGGDRLPWPGAGPGGETATAALSRIIRRRLRS